MEKQENKVRKMKKEEKIVGTIVTRGRKFEGNVIRKFDKRVTIEFERVNFIRKYERYLKTKTKMHARLPEALKDQINIGDLIQIQECRPISKITHHIVIKKIAGTEAKK